MRDRGARLAVAASTPTLRVGRATRRPRNPANAPAGWQADTPAHLETLPAGERGAAMFTRALPGGALAYATPLVASVRFTKRDDGHVTRESLGAVRFVPLIGAEAWPELTT